MKIGKIKSVTTVLIKRKHEIQRPILYTFQGRKAKYPRIFKYYGIILQLVVEKFEWKGIFEVLFNQVQYFCHSKPLKYVDFNFYISVRYCESVGRSMNSYIFYISLRSKQ